MKTFSGRLEHIYCLHLLLKELIKDIIRKKEFESSKNGGQKKKSWVDLYISFDCMYITLIIMTDLIGTQNKIGLGEKNE